VARLAPAHPTRGERGAGGGGGDERPAPVVGAVRADRLRDRAAEDADAGSHASLAAGHAAFLRPAVRGVRRADLDHAPALAQAARGQDGVIRGFRLTWWDLALLAVMAVGVVLAVVRYGGGIASVANINN